MRPLTAEAGIPGAAKGAGLDVFCPPEGPFAREVQATGSVLAIRASQILVLCGHNHGSGEIPAEKMRGVTSLAEYGKPRTHTARNARARWRETQDRIELDCHPAEVEPFAATQ